MAQRSLISNCLGMAALAFAWIALKQPGTRPVGVYGFMGSTLDPDGGASRVPIRTMAVTRQPVEMNQTKVMILDGVRTETPVFTADHAICIVGDPRLNARGEVTGDDCYVCDPWAQRIYNAVNIKAESQLLARVTGGSDRITPTVRLEAGQTLPPTIRDIIGIAA